MNTYELSIRAIDMGSPSLASPVAALVRVHVRDVNDRPPQLVMPARRVTLTLPTVHGVLITAVEAIDEDTVNSSSTFPSLFCRLVDCDSDYATMARQQRHLCSQSTSRQVK
jgi:hypothetical protein